MLKNFHLQFSLVRVIDLPLKVKKQTFSNSFQIKQDFFVFFFFQEKKNKFFFKKIFTAFKISRFNTTVLSLYCINFCSVTFLELGTIIIDNLEQQKLVLEKNILFLYKKKTDQTKKNRLFWEKIIEKVNKTMK